MIWIWHIPDEWPNKRIGKCVENTGTDRFAFMNASYLNPHEVVCPDVVFECQEKFLFEVLPNSGFLLITSDKVIDILNAICPNDFQTFEANIYANDKKIEGYKLINILNSVDIVDKEKSKFKTFKGTSHIMSFDKIVYKHESLIAHDIVRNADYKSHILVSDRIKVAFENAKIKGVQFDEK